MPEIETTECTIKWHDIINSDNPEQFIFRQLQLNNIAAYTENGIFAMSSGRLHCIDDPELRERVYVWTRPAGAYPFCRCVTCAEKRTLTVTPFTRDFKFRLIQQLARVNAVPFELLNIERTRIQAVIDIRARRDRIQLEQARVEAQLREDRLRTEYNNSQRRRIELAQIQNFSSSYGSQQKQKQKKPVVIEAEVQETVPKRQLRVKD